MEIKDKFILLGKDLGLDDTDFAELEKDDVDENAFKERMSGFSSKVFNNHKERLKGDTEFTSQFTKDFDQRLIGLTNKSKKAIRKEFSLDLKEDELSKISMEDLLKEAKKVTSGTMNVDLQTERQKYLDSIEEREKLISDYEAKLKSEQDKTLEFEQSYEIKNSLKTAILTETSIKPESVDMALGAYNGYLNLNGYKLSRDSKKHLILVDAKTNAVVMNGNAIVKVGDTIKELFAALVPFKNGRGTMDNFDKNQQNTDRVPHPSEKYLEMMNEGLV